MSRSGSKKGTTTANGRLKRRQVRLKGLTPEEFRNQSLAA
ncbi:IS3 family transposase [Curtanaerobium respiraculi]